MAKEGEYVECEECLGAGEINDKKCKCCRGLGKLFVIPDNVALIKISKVKERLYSIKSYSSKGEEFFF